MPPPPSGTAVTSPGIQKVHQADPRPTRWRPQPHNDDPDVRTYDFAYLSGMPDPTLASKAVAAIKTILLPLITQPLLLRTLLLIFGGCCSNVYTLESILTLSSSTGTLITFLQFLFITLYTLPSQLQFWVTSDHEPCPLQPTQRTWLPRLKRRKVPLTKWMLFAGQFAMINVLNNAAFGYKISLPLHIILRSAGPVASMLVGYIWAGRTYSSRKVLAVGLLFMGVVLAALSDASSKAPSTSTGPTSKDDGLKSNSTASTAVSTSTSTENTHPLLDQAPGFALLTLALLLSAVMGTWSDGIYTTYGRTPAIADEQLFYGHLLSLPFFALQYNTLQTQFERLLAASAASSPSTTRQAKDSSDLSFMTDLMDRFSVPRNSTWQDRALQLFTLEHVPKAVTYLVLNSITQIACISGVHHLSTQTSALTVSIVLNVRKVVSLLLSIYLFGNSLPIGVLVGAGVVFFGGGLYGIPDKKPEKKVGGKEGGVDGKGETKKDR